MRTMFKNITRLSKLRLILIIITTQFVINGCALFQPPCGEDCKAKYLCDGLHAKYVNNERAFNLVRKASTNELTRFHCIWRTGLVLPKGKKYWEKLIDEEHTIYDRLPQDKQTAKASK